MQNAGGADTFFFLFAVENHAAAAGEHGEKKADVLEERIFLRGELDPESLVQFGMRNAECGIIFFCGRRG